MKRALPLLLGLLSLALAGCGAADAPAIQDDGLTIHNPHDGLWQDHAEVPIRFELEQTFGAEEEPVEAVIGAIWFPTADDVGNVYVIDITSNRLLSFGADGGLRWAVGRQGQGPGEFQYPNRMLWREDRLFVTNQNGTRLDEFGADGRYLGGRPLGIDSLIVASPVGWLSGDRLVFSGARPGHFGAAFAVGRPADPWQIVAYANEDHVQNLPGVGTLGLPAPAFVHGDRIFVAHLAEYRIAIYDSTATLVRIITRDLHDFVRPGYHRTEQGGASIISLGGIRPILVLSEGRMLALAVWPTKALDPDEYVRRRMEGESVDPQFRHSIDLFDADGKLLYSLEGEGDSPEIGKPEFVDAAGRLYTSTLTPYPHLRRYRVIIDAP